MVIDSLVSTLSANPLLAGGVGTVAFGSLMYVLRSVPGKIVSFVERTFWTKLFVESLSNEFLDIDGFVERNRLSFFSRSLEVKDGALKTGFGGGWGRYGGTLFHSPRRSPRSRSRRSRASRYRSSRGIAA